MKNKKKVDFLLMIFAITLALLGVLMVFSASWPASTENKNGDGTFYLIKQANFFGLGLIMMYIFSKINYKIYMKLAFLGYIVALLLGTVGIKFLGIEYLGATRWISIFGVDFMPSDLMKMATIMYLSAFLVQNKGEIKNLLTFFKIILIISLPLGTIAGFQSDLGTAITLAATLMVIIFTSGIPIKYLMMTGTGGVFLAIAAIIQKPYRADRIKTFLDPFNSEDGFQIVQSLYAIGSGGILGSGLGQSKQKYFYLPESFGDMIFAVIAEELGFIGVLLILVIYLFLMWRGIKIALNCKELFGSYLAMGLTSLIIVQTLVHIGVSISIIPSTGITMPFMSYGGTSLIINMSIIGILLNISRTVER